MLETSLRRAMLDIIPLAKQLEPQDLQALSRQFPDIDVAGLLEQAGAMGGDTGQHAPSPPSAMPAPSTAPAPRPAPAPSAAAAPTNPPSMPYAPSAAPAPRPAPAPSLASEAPATDTLSKLKFGIDLAQKSIARTLPKCDPTLAAVRSRLKQATRADLARNVLVVAGSGVAALSAAAAAHVPATAGASIAALGSVFELYQRFKRLTLRNGVDLSELQTTISDGRLQLQTHADLFDLTARTDPQSLLSNSEAIFEALRDTTAITKKVGQAIEDAASLI